MGRSDYSGVKIAQMFTTSTSIGETESARESRLGCGIRAQYSFTFKKANSFRRSTADSQERRELHLVFRDDSDAVGERNFGPIRSGRDNLDDHFVALKANLPTVVWHGRGC